MPDFLFFSFLSFVVVLVSVLLLYILLFTVLVFLCHNHIVQHFNFVVMCMPGVCIYVHMHKN